MAFNLRSGKPFKDAFKGLRLLIKGAISPKEMMAGESHGEEQVSRHLSNGCTSGNEEASQ